ncbi:MAG: FIST C-terminal domain-containing protein [Treponema sp.]|nr:FIST C-terminal domain-containing protein [Treponema sp.]
MEQEVVSSKKVDIEEAVKELCGKLRKGRNEYQAVIFMASISYDFELLSKSLKEQFPESEVIGTSTAGEISPAGFASDSIVLTTMCFSADENTRLKGVLVEHGSKYPVASIDNIKAALQDCGIRCADANSHKNAFALAFINGVFNAEETILTTFYSVIKNDDFPLAGGTAGYTGNVAKTYVSYNGKTTQDGAVFLFVKTACKFDIRQEDIFNPTGKSVFVTESNPVTRTISKLNNESPKSVYARLLGVDEKTAEGMTFENPFGRYLNGSFHIAALAGFTPDRKITLFARIVPNSTIELMHIGDPLKKADETCNGIKELVARPKFVLLMTCITRTLAFERMGISREIIQKYNNVFPSFCGFSCYGEQIGRIHCNQTLVTLTIGNKE